MRGQKCGSQISPDSYLKFLLARRLLTLFLHNHSSIPDVWPFTVTLIFFFFFTSTIEMRLDKHIFFVFFNKSGKLFLGDTVVQ